MVPFSRISSNPRLDTSSVSKVMGSDEETFVVFTDRLKRVVQERVREDGHFRVKRIKSSEKWGKFYVTREIPDFPRELIKNYP